MYDLQFHSRLGVARLLCWCGKKVQLQGILTTCLYCVNEKTCVIMITGHSLKAAMCELVNFMWA